jgi:GntR family transcriptional regulator
VNVPLSDDKGHRVEALFDSDIPMHYQIYQQLRAEILDGIWVGRADFPGEEEVASRYGVSVITSRHALVRLVEEKLLKRERGRRPQATFVPSVSKEEASAPSVFPTGPRHPYAYQVIETEVRVAHTEACRAFGLKSGVELWHCTRLRKFEGRPHSVVLNVQRIDIGKKHKASDLAKLPMNQIFRKEGYQLGAIERRISAKPPSKTAAQYLGISVNTSLLIHTFVLADHQDAPLEWVQIALHPNELPPLERFDLRTGVAKVSDIL